MIKHTRQEINMVWLEDCLPRFMENTFFCFSLGNIITGPKNFQTNPTKKGLGNTTVGHLFSPVEYGTDPFHRAKEMDIVKFLEFFTKCSIR